MNAVVRNGCCEIRGGAGKPRVTLPPMNIDEAILHRDHVAVVLRNGYYQLYNTEGKLVTTYSVNDAKFVRFVGDDQLAGHPPPQRPRRNPRLHRPSRPRVRLIRARDAPQSRRFRSDRQLFYIHCILPAQGCVTSCFGPQPSSARRTRNGVS